MLTAGQGLVSQIGESEKYWIMRVSDLQQPFLPLFLYTLGLTLVALLVGGLLDSTFTEVQGSRATRWWCGLYFLLQLMVNLILILAVARYFLPFLPWLQLSIAGIVAAVVYFAVQQQLVDNALCLVAF